MPAFSLNRAQAAEIVAAVEQALSEGYPPPGSHNLGSHGKSAIRVAAERLGLHREVARGQIGSPDYPGSIYRALGLAVDWSKYRTPERPKATPAQPETAPVETPKEPVGDQIDVRRLKDKVSSLEAALRGAQRRAVEAEDYRASVLGLHELPPYPMRFAETQDGEPSGETIVLLLSDLHWGERVDLGAMDGLNSYSLDIARSRLARWTRTVIDLATEHWSGPPPDRIIIVLGGDLVSGGIHYELAKTDELAPLPAVKDVADHLRNAIVTIKEGVGCLIDVISLPGNHARTTIKPESKSVADTSLDTLVSDFLELALREVPGISFFAPPSPDALFSVYGWRVLASHGDKIGSRGGQGFVGPAATAARGLKRMTADYAARGVHVDIILLCHLHTPLMLEEGFVNGSLPGPTEYSRDSRFRPHPATQLFFTIHPRHRVAQIRWIEVGHPDEGSLYEPPPVDRPLRPRFRVKAIGMPS